MRKWMIKTVLMTAVAMIVLAFGAGCETDFLRRNAQESTAGFLTGVFADVISETIAPE